MNAAALEVYRTIRRDGTQAAVLPKMQTRAELYEFLNYHAYEEQLDALTSEKLSGHSVPRILENQLTQYASNIAGNLAQANNPSWRRVENSSLFFFGTELLTCRFTEGHDGRS